MNSEQEKARLLHLYESALRAHLENDATTFLAEYASQWYEVRNAGVRLRTKEEALPAIEQYFKRTHFSDISQVAAAIIHLSTDASMAWVIGEMRVRAVQEVSDGQELVFSLHGIWFLICVKINVQWLQTADAPSSQSHPNFDRS